MKKMKNILISFLSNGMTSAGEINQQRSLLQIVTCTSTTKPKTMCVS